MKYNKIIPILVMLILLTGCKSNGNMSKHSDSFIGTFDTVITVVAYNDSDEEYIDNYNYIRDKFKYYNDLFDIYNSYDGLVNLKDINDNAGIVPVEVNEDILAVLKFGKEMYRETNGEVNIAFGSVLLIWEELKEDAGAGKEINWKYYDEKLKKASKHTDIDNIIIDEDKKTVYINDADMSIDLGSIGKGFAEEMIIESMRDAGINNVLLNAGGSVVVTDPKMDDSWIVGIQNPDLNSDKQIFMKIRLNNEAMVSSGNYQRFFTIDDKKYHHIIDKDTLYPAKNFASVTVISDSSSRGDAFSTALFNMNIEDGKKLIENIDGYEALWIYDNGDVERTKGFERYIDEK